MSKKKEKEISKLEKKLEREERIEEPGLEKEPIFIPEDVKVTIFEVESEMEWENKKLFKVGMILKNFFGPKKPAIVLEMIRELLPKFRDKIVKIEKRELKIREMVEIKKELLEWIEKKVESEEVLWKLGRLNGVQVLEYLQEIEKKLN